MIFGNAKSIHPFHLSSSTKELGSLRLEFHIGLYTLYGCQIYIICFFHFFNVAFMFENISIQSSNVHFFGNIFKIIELEIFKNNLCFCWELINPFNFISLTT